jgi:murein DD-endopeptidase / murein LD-carboxypeptidase
LIRTTFLFFAIFYLYVQPGRAQLLCDSALSGVCIDTLKSGFKETVCDWIGTPYNYSGDSRDGIDCSGFVAMFYKKVFDLELGASSTDIYTSNVTPLQKKKLLPSDLVFFRIGKKVISHVGIYLGNNKFIHASTKLGVIISDLNEPYYRKYFYKGGRIKDLISKQE